MTIHVPTSVTLFRISWKLWYSSIIHRIHQTWVLVTFFFTENKLSRRRYQPQTTPGSVIGQCLQGVPKKSTYLHSESGIWIKKLSFCLGRTHQLVGTSKIWISPIMCLAEPKYHLRNDFNFSNVHGIMNTSGLVQSKWSPKGFTLTLQETWSIHDSMNIPKIEFITYIYILYYQSSINFNFHLTWLVFQIFWIKSDIT